jgi:hypothetical protein
MSNPILILHGWSDNYESFLELKRWLCAQGRQVRDVFLGNYESMEDHVSFDDLADGLQTRFEEMALQGDVSSLKPFSLDVIVHSTGGLVVRHWLHHYIQDICKGDFDGCPIKRLIMLAPANFGSRLAEQGKSGLAKIFKGGLAHGFETGKLILQGLELGSPVTWRIAEQDLFLANKLYRCSKDRGPFVFVFSGTGTYGDLKGFVAPGANEDGSDGTVRAAAASLNSIKLVLDCSKPAAPTAAGKMGNYDAFAFALIPGKNHSEVVPADADDPTHPIFHRIKQCLEVDTDVQYEKLRTQFEGENDAFYAGEAIKADGERVHKYQQFLVRVRDDMRNDVTDYRIDFHIVDKTIVQSTWDPKKAETLESLRRYQKLTQFLQDQVIANVNKHSVSPSYRTFFINLDKLEELRERIKKQAAGAFIGLNLDAAGPTRDITYDTDRLRYLPVEIKISDGRGGGVDFFKANTSTLVEIALQRVPGRGVFEFLWDKKP